MTAQISIWFEGDAGPASIEYKSTYRGNAIVAFDRFTKTAFRKFPNAVRVEVEVV